MTKIMTAIIVFDLLKQDKIKLSDEVIVSENAWRMSKEWLFINVYYVK